jgi:hypothetical protein
MSQDSSVKNITAFEIPGKFDALSRRGVMANKKTRRSLGGWTKCGLPSLCGSSLISNDDPASDSVFRAKICDDDACAGESVDYAGKAVDNTKVRFCVRASRARIRRSRFGGRALASGKTVYDPAFCKRRTSQYCCQ